MRPPNQFLMTQMGISAESSGSNVPSGASVGSVTPTNRAVVAGKPPPAGGETKEGRSFPVKWRFKKVASPDLSCSRQQQSLPPVDTSGGLNDVHVPLTAAVKSSASHERELSSVKRKPPPPPADLAATRDELVKLMSAPPSSDDDGPHHHRHHGLTGNNIGKDDAVRRKVTGGHNHNNHDDPDDDDKEATGEDDEKKAPDKKDPIDPNGSTGDVTSNATNSPTLDNSETQYVECTV